MRQSKAKWVEIPVRDYEVLFHGKAHLIYYHHADFEITYVNGKAEQSHLNESYVEIRHIDASPRCMMYIYCSNNHHFYSTDDLKEACDIFYAELLEMNKIVAASNEYSRKKSIKDHKANEQKAAA
jgi:hypothetical protein